MLVWNFLRKNTESGKITVSDKNEGRNSDKNEVFVRKCGNQPGVKCEFWSKNASFVKNVVSNKNVGLDRKCWV